MWANLDTPISADVCLLLAKTYGPHAAIREALGQIAGVDQAFVFGSWAARWHREPALIPNDIDLMVIGDVAGDVAHDVWTAVAGLSNRLGIAVNPVIRTLAEWVGDPTGFAATVQQGPLGRTSHRIPRGEVTA